MSRRGATLRRHPSVFCVRRRGFTLIEMLIVLGILGLIATIILVAINPSRQLDQTRDAERRATVRETQNALNQYLIEMGQDPLSAPVGKENAIDLCRFGVTDPSCVALPQVLTTQFLTKVPLDLSETNTLITGYKVYRDLQGRFYVCNAYLTSGDAACNPSQGSSSIVSSVSSSDSSSEPSASSVAQGTSSSASSTTTSVLEESSSSQNSDIFGLSFSTSSDTCTFSPYSSGASCTYAVAIHITNNGGFANSASFTLTLPEGGEASSVSAGGNWWCYNNTTSLACGTSQIDAQGGTADGTITISLRMASAPTFGAPYQYSATLTPGDDFPSNDTASWYVWFADTGASSSSSVDPSSSSETSSDSSSSDWTSPSSESSSDWSSSWSDTSSSESSSYASGGAQSIAFMASSTSYNCGMNSSGRSSNYCEYSLWFTAVNNEASASSVNFTVNLPYGLSYSIGTAHSGGSCTSVDSSTMSCWTNNIEPSASSAFVIDISHTEPPVPAYSAPYQISIASPYGDAAYVTFTDAN